MKMKSRDGGPDDLRPEYDLRQLLKKGVQGKYARRYHQETNVVVLDPDMAERFPNSEAVNQALRSLARVLDRTESNLGR